MKLERDVFRQIANLLAILAAFGTNVAANIAPIKGLSSSIVGNLAYCTPSGKPATPRSTPKELVLARSPDRCL